MTIEELRESGRIIYDHYRGSHIYGTAIETSDWDKGGVFIETPEELNGLGINVSETISDERHDETYHSLGKYMRLLLNSNPNILESLFVDDHFVIYEHPIISELKSHRDEFVTKKCFGSFFGYAKTQIEKARSLKKKIVTPMEGPRKSAFEFCYTFKDQGSYPIKDWLEERGLNQKYCGLVNIPNMIAMYGLYYDYGRHLYEEMHATDINDFLEKLTKFTWCMDAGKHGRVEKSYREYFKPFTYFFLDNGPMAEYNVVKRNSKGLYEVNFEGACEFYNKYSEVYGGKQLNYGFGYHGIVNDEESSNEVRLSSVMKGEKPICFMSYYKDGYSAYCRQYREYVQFKENRNEERFNLAKEKQFDRKNMAHAVRLLNMGVEIAQGKGFNLDRTNIDSDLILSVRRGEKTYDEIMEYLSYKVNEMETSVLNSKIPDEIDVEMVNNLLLKMRKNYWKS